MLPLQAHMCKSTNFKMHNSPIHTNGAEILDFLLCEEKMDRIYFSDRMSSILQFQTLL